MISVVVPVYNAEKYIEPCLYAISIQTYKDFEVIIVDDGSTDGTKSIIEDYASKDHRIKPYYNDNHGVSYTRNFALKHCKGDYLAFVDSDDIISPDFLETLLYNLLQYDADLSAVNVMSSSKYDKGIFTCGDTSILTEKNIFEGLFGIYDGFLCNKIYKKEIIVENNILLDNEIAFLEDLLFNAEYLKYCKKVVYNSGVKYFYRQVSSSATNRIDNLKWFDFLEVYPRIIDIIKMYPETKLKIEGIYILYLCDALYRIKHLNNVSDELKNKVKKEKMIMDKKKKKFSKKQRIKIFIFEHFPSIVIKYKQRKL